MRVLADVKSRIQTEGGRATRQQDASHQYAWRDDDSSLACSLHEEHIVHQDFLTGFVLPSGDVWGRPVGVTVAPDGSLLVSDDGSNSIWRVVYEKK